MLDVGRPTAIISPEASSRRMEPQTTDQTPNLPEAPASGRRRRLALGAGVLALTLAATAAALVLRGDLAAWRESRAARASLAAGQPEAALARLDAWVRRRPGSAEAHFLRGEALSALDRLAEALDAYAQARDRGHPVVELDRPVGILLARVGRRDEAEPMLRRAHERRSGPDARLDEALAKIHLESYRLEPALAAIRRWAEADPESPRPYLWKAEVDSRLPHNLDALADDYREALRRDPDQDGASLGLARTLRDAGRFDEAAEEFRRYLGRHPDDPSALAGAGVTAVELGRDGEAIGWLDRAIQLDPKNKEALAGRAEVALRRGEFAQAATLLRRAKALDPDAAAVRYQLALALDRLGRSEEAQAERAASERIRREQAEMESIRKALAASPGDADLQYRAARWLLDHGHVDEALAWALRAVGAPGGHPPSAGLLADHYASRGDVGLANFYRLQAGPRGADAAGNVPQD